MKSGQFYRGKIDGIQKHYESLDLDDILPASKLCVLADYTQEGEYFHFFRQEHVLTRTVVSEAKNEDGRLGGIINHTVLYKFDHTVTHETVRYTFNEDFFIMEVRDGKRKFKMPPAPTLPEEESILVDFPPQIEWEVTS